MVNSEKIYSFVAQKFPKFGVNKRQEIVRLVYEISKKEECPIEEIFAFLPAAGRYRKIKDYLLARRFPELPHKERRQGARLPVWTADPGLKVILKEKQDVTAQNFYIEESVRDSLLAQRLRKKFPQASHTYIQSYKSYNSLISPGIKEYNHRLETFYIIKENFDFLKACPCSNDSVFCGYYVINLGSGCPFECTYCYLQDYLNSPGIIIPANIEDFFKKFEEYGKDVRIGSGELTDSLAFDHITEFSVQIVEFFKKYPKSTFEFKTKSDNVGLLASVVPAGNIVVSWSINPQKVIGAVEHYTASLGQRLQAAKRCQEAGYKIVFHFDPIIFYHGWERDYQELVNQIFDQLGPNGISWLSLGTLRMTPRLKKIIENRFPETSILNEEFVMGHDSKLRYSQKLRMEIYKKMQGWIMARSPDTPMYLCMEDKITCRETAIFPAKKLNHPL